MMVVKVTRMSVMMVAIGGVVNGVIGWWQRCDIIIDGGGCGDVSGSINGRGVIPILAMLEMKMVVVVVLSFSQQKTD